MGEKRARGEQDVAAQDPKIELDAPRNPGGVDGPDAAALSRGETPEGLEGHIRGLISGEPNMLRAFDLMASNSHMAGEDAMEYIADNVGVADW